MRSVYIIQPLFSVKIGGACRPARRVYPSLSEVIGGICGALHCRINYYRNSWILRTRHGVSLHVLNNCCCGIIPDIFIVELPHCQIVELYYNARRNALRLYTVTIHYLNFQIISLSNFQINYDGRRNALRPYTYPCHHLNWHNLSASWRIGILSNWHINELMN